MRRAAHFNPCRVVPTLRAILLGVALPIGFAPLAADGLGAKVQAAYLFNFVKFVEWPTDETSLVICVAGAELVGELLSDLAQRSKLKHTLHIVAGRPDDPASCQMLYIDQHEPRRAELLRQSRGRPVLTVSDAPHFVAEGGIVGFYLDDGRLKVEIAVATARAAGFKISGKLLEIARIVE